LLFSHKNHLISIIWFASTTTQNGVDKSIEYNQLKATTLAGKCQEIYAAILAFQELKTV